MVRDFIFLLVIFLLSRFGFAQSSQNWNSFRGNGALTGFTDASIPHSMDIKWSYKTDGAIKSSPVIASNRIVVSSTDQFIYCFDMSGKLLWKFKTTNSVEASPIISGNSVFVGDLSGSLFAIDLLSGKKLWEYKTENQIMGAANYQKIKNKEIIVVGSYDFYLHGIDAKTGKGLWKCESDNYINGTASCFDNKAIFGGCDGFLHIVDITSGKEITKVELGTYIAGSATIDKGKVFVGDYEGGFWCVDLKTYKVLWKYKATNSEQAFIASPTVSNNHVIIGSRDKFVYCFNIEDGKIEWKKNSGSRVDASAIANSKETLVANMRGDLIIYSIENGETITTFELGTPVASNPAVVSGKIVVCGIDGVVYCLDKLNKK